MAQEHPPCFRPITAIALSVNATEKITRSPLTTFVPHAAEAFLNSHHAQHFSSSCLTPCEVLPLPDLHITPLHCSSLHLATLLPSISDKVHYNCSVLTDLLAPWNDLQKISWVKLTSHSSLVIIYNVTIVNTVLGIPLQLLWVLLSQQLYLWLLQPNRMNCTLA